MMEIVDHQLAALQVSFSTPSAAKSGVQEEEEQ
jgi:hypothetical protein